MTSLNNVQIIGNLTREPELRHTKNGNAVATIGVATNRKWRDSTGAMQDEAEYHNVVLWGRLAEIACQYLKKGSKVFFAGRLKTRSWEDDAAAKHYRTEIIAQDMIMLSRSENSGAPAQKISQSHDEYADLPEIDMGSGSSDDTDMPF